MAADIEKIKDRIRKLFRVAEDDAASQGEVENALRAAQSLIYAYQLDEAELMKDDTPEQRERRMNRHQTFTTSAKLAVWETSLAHFLCEMIGTVKWYYERGAVLRKTDAGFVRTNFRGKPMRGLRVYFYGIEDDAVMAAQMFEELSVTIVALARLQTGGSPYSASGRSYAAGFVAGLRSKIEKVQQQLRNDSTGTALVVQNFSLQIRKEAENWIQKELGCRLQNRKKRRRSLSSTDHYEQGVRDGKAYDLDQARKRKIGEQKSIGRD